MEDPQILILNPCSDSSSRQLANIPMSQDESNDTDMSANAYVCCYVRSVLNTQQLWHYLTYLNCILIKNVFVATENVLN